MFIITYYIIKIDVEGQLLKVIKKSKIYESISVIYIETENNTKSINELKYILKKFKYINKENVVNNKYKNKNINLIFIKKDYKTNLKKN